MSTELYCQGRRPIQRPVVTSSPPPQPWSCPVEDTYLRGFLSPVSLSVGVEEGSTVTCAA